MFDLKRYSKDQKIEIEWMVHIIEHDERSRCVKIILLSLPSIYNST